MPDRLGQRRELSVSEKHVIALARPGQGQPAGRVGPDAVAPHGLLADGGHEVDGLADAGRTEAASGEAGDPACQSFEGDAVELNRLPGRHDVKAQDRSLLMAGFRLCLRASPGRIRRR